MDNILDDTTDVPVALSKVERAQARRVFVQVGVGFELESRYRQNRDNLLDFRGAQTYDGMRAPLGTDNTTHSMQVESKLKTQTKPKCRERNARATNWEKGWRVRIT